MADNEYTLGITTTLPSSVAFGATVYAAATAQPHTFVPSYDGVSALELRSFSASASNSTLTYTISAPQAFPVQLTWDGANASKFVFNIKIDNNSPDANTTGTVVFDVSSLGTALSSGGSGSMHDSISETSPATVIALGAPASAITAFTATPYASYIKLDWVKPSGDLTSINVKRSLTTTVNHVSVGELIYTGLLTTYNDTSSVGLSGFYYGAYAIDGDGNVSTVTSVSAMGVLQQNYPDSDDVTQNVLDPLSLTYETYNSRRQRLIAEDVI
jgi:hypothetical protein